MPAIVPLCQFLTITLQQLMALAYLRQCGSAVEESWRAGGRVPRCMPVAPVPPGHRLSQQVFPPCSQKPLYSTHSPHSHQRSFPLEQPSSPPRLRRQGPHLPTTITTKAVLLACLKLFAGRSACAVASPPREASCGGRPLRMAVWPRLESAAVGAA